MSNTYRDGIKGERCLFCHSLLKLADGEPQVSVRVSDLEEVVSILVEYIDLPDVWGETITRFEEALGLTWEQIKARDRAKRLSAQASS